MIARDRDLLARAARVNRHLGDVVVELMQRQDGGQLPAHGLRELGDRLAGLADELRSRADELDHMVIEAGSGA